MERYTAYCSIKQFNLQRIENIEDRNLIHQFENKDIEINIENLREKYMLNQIR